MTKDDSSDKTVTALRAEATLQRVSTIVIRGRTYAVEVVPKDSDPVGSLVGSGPRYVLRGSRGARYTTMRNVNTPHLMFLVNERSFVATSVTDGVWLSDKDGELKVVEA